jgi:dUTP pyrophosphatase
MKVKIKKLNSTAVIPSYAKEGDAGLDLTAVSMDITKDYVEYGTGLAIEIPEGYVGLIFPRSSVSKKDLILANSVGVIDSGYRGEVKIRFKQVTNYCVSNFKYNFLKYDINEKVAQLIILPVPYITFVEAEELSDTSRGEGGFGSTGK